jgi:diphosphomevalonate decarboxylase
MIYENPSLVLHTPEVSGSVTWKSPSNLAIVKYWGKHGMQLPGNASLSLTLSKSCTETTVDYKSSQNPGKISLSFTFEGREEPAFEKRIKKFLESILEYFPFLTQLDLNVSSKNTFPHSSGIASSASSMSALSLALCELENQLFQSLEKEKFYEKASFISRLGSGSASRSIFPVASVWGFHSQVEDSSDLFAIPWQNEVDPVFHTFRDSILIVSPRKKKVSSSAGHQLMDENVYAPSRYKQAYERMIHLVKAMKKGDIHTFGKISEDEALTLHALMMCSEPAYMLIEPGSVAIMKAVRAFREESDIPVYYSLDAGPNVHLLYPQSVEEKVRAFIDAQLLQYCFEGRVIHDKVGRGPMKI